MKLIKNLTKQSLTFYTYSLILLLSAFILIFFSVRLLIAPSSFYFVNILINVWNVQMFSNFATNEYSEPTGDKL